MVTSSERVAVVVVTYNSASLVPELIDSFGPGLGPIEHEVIFADNGSTDETIAKVREFAPKSTVVEMGRNAGYAAGINAAVRAASAHTAILVLNPDVRLGPACVPSLLVALRTPGTGIAVPRLVDGESKLIESMHREPTVVRAFGEALLGARRAGRYPWLGEIVSKPSAYDSESLTDWAEGSTQLISRACWDFCGPWDESFFLYSEETEYGLRAGDAGFATRYVPTARATHLEGASANSPTLWRLLVVNRVRLFRRRNGLAKTVPFWVATLVREMRRALAGRPIGRAGVAALLTPRLFRDTPGPGSLR